MKVDETQQLGRREFNVMAALAVLSSVAITVTGCGYSDPGSDGPTSPQQPVADRVGAISANHGHSARITGAQLTGGNTVMLDIQGAADHRHRVELSAAEIDQIRNGREVAKESSTEQSPTEPSHRHTVTFN
jgi:hypothetical protein